MCTSIKITVIDNRDYLRLSIALIKMLEQINKLYLITQILYNL